MKSLGKHCIVFGLLRASTERKAMSDSTAEPLLCEALQKVMDDLFNRRCGPKRPDEEVIYPPDSTTFCFVNMFIVCVRRVESQFFSNQLSFRSVNSEVFGGKTECTS